jgi:alpha-amylase
MFSVMAACANPWNGQVLLQGFWWNYWNNNYPNDWATYLAELAPRLHGLGINAVWIPPTDKNADPTGSVGYAPFDHYDLGDKWQKGSTTTRFGTKDAYLRAVAVLHANGISVIQDMVWNHLDGAGSAQGGGGLDPTAPTNNQYMNFRYVGWTSPATSESAANYLARNGRFPKNWQNFHPNPAHNTVNDIITEPFFGPDICYYVGARGSSGNATYNPAQGQDYMRNGIRAWSVWLKKQTGVDGFRLDATKLFESWATKDFVWNLAHNAGFASGGDHMFCVGEFVDSAANMDAWVDAVNNSNGFVDVTGTFDFSLRGAIKDTVAALGSKDIGTLPGAQQQRRNRTVPFVNSHDTFRPNLDANGRYIGWDSGNELGGHIDPSDPRVQLAYAVAFAVDGSPCVYFEDLFDLNSTGKRWTHRPQDTNGLPVRDYLANLIWCHQNLNFKDGAYLVRWEAPDLLVIERSAHALIAVNDNYSNAQSATVATAFGANVRLHDYSGANTADIFTDATGMATLHVPPCDGSNRRRGYAVWGPAGIGGAFSPSPRATTQEWEMADDLGDSHSKSLQQGGALPSNSTATRTVGRIFPAWGSTATIQLYPASNGVPIRCWVENAAGAVVANITGTNSFSLAWTAAAAEWHTIRVANGSVSNPNQKVWVNVTYAAPHDLRAPSSPAFANDNVTGGEFEADVVGPSDVPCILAQSPDLRTWSNLATNSPPFHFTVPAAPVGARFYVLRPAQ